LITLGLVRNGEKATDANALCPVGRPGGWVGAANRHWVASIRTGWDCHSHAAGMIAWRGTPSEQPVLMMMLSRMDRLIWNTATLDGEGR
jgi:hypothetical protein